MLRATSSSARPSASASSARGLRFGIAAAEYNPALAEPLVEHCLKALIDAGAKRSQISIVRVPGSFEVSVAAAWLARSRRCDCIIGLGVLLQGATRHADHIGAAVAQGLTQVAISSGVPTVFGIVTANNQQQARVRCQGRKYNRGREAALTAIQMARQWKNL